MHLLNWDKKMKILDRIICGFEALNMQFKDIFIVFTEAAKAGWFGKSLEFR